MPSVIPLIMNLPQAKGQQSHGVWSEEILWYRLHYRLTPAAVDGVGRSAAEGFFSLGHILENAFDLEVAAWQTDASVRRGFEALVRAIHPLSREPIPGVELSGSVEYEDSAAVIPVSAKVMTDRNGYARLLFTVPPQEEDRKAGISVAGRKGGYATHAKRKNKGEASAA